MDWQAETDVLVIGGGGGGLVAALSARAQGASVALVEKTRRVGGNTALSSGSVPGAGTRFQVEAGIDDSPKRFAADIMRRTGDTAPRPLVELLAKESAPLVEWLVDDVGIPLRLTRDLKKVGHSVPRTHGPPGRHGSILVDTLERVARELDVHILEGNAVRGLLADSNGDVMGAVVQAGERAAADNIRARKVILACNGFGGDREMLRRYCPEIAEAPYFGHPGNVGEGIGWGIELGARLRNMGAYQGHASVAYPHGSLLSWTVMEMGGCLVNLAGERFVNESLGYSGCTTEVLAQPERLAFALLDRRIADYMARNVPDFVELTNAGGVKTGDDPRRIAGELKIEGAALARTIDEFNEAARGGGDRLGREEFGGAPLRPSFSLVRVTAGLFHTQGGLDVDANAQPVREDGRPIGNLYAVGGVAVGVSGAHGGKGYCSANGLLAALGLGRVAGRHAGQEIQGSI